MEPETGLPLLAFALGAFFIGIGIRDRRRAKPGAKVLIVSGVLAVLAGLGMIVFVNGLASGWSPN